MVWLLHNFDQSKGSKRTTCNNLICCKTGTNMGGKMKHIAFQLILQQSYSLNKLHVFCLFFSRFTIVTWHFQHHKAVFWRKQRVSVTLRTGNLQISDDPTGLVRKTWNNKVNYGTYPENQTAATYRGLIKLEVLKSYNGKVTPLFEEGKHMTVMIKLIINLWLQGYCGYRANQSSSLS